MGHNKDGEWVTADWVKERILADIVDDPCVCGDYKCVGECCDPRSEMYMGSDSDFSDHALGIDY